MLTTLGSAVSEFEKVACIHSFRPHVVKVGRGLASHHEVLDGFVGPV